MTAKADIMQLSTLGPAQLLMCGSSCRTTFSNERWISIWPEWSVLIRRLTIKGTDLAITETASSLGD